MGLDHIEAGAFCNLHHLLRLNLQDNKLQTPLELCELKCCIDTLILSGNNLTNLGPKFFEGYKKLRHINLNNNKLVVLPDLHWIKHSLKTMLAYSNNMKSLDEFEITSVFESLLYMDMGRNRIYTFNVTILRHMPKLHTLLLYGNKLTYIDNFRIHYKKAIDLRDNPWHCGTALSWMGEDDMAFEDGLTCETPACMQGIAIADMSKYNKPQNKSFVHFSIS